MSTGLLVVGAGLADYAAAPEAARLGAQVAVLEKMPEHGGSTVINT